MRASECCRGRPQVYVTVKPLFSLLSSIDVTEVQIFIIIMYLLAAVGGSAFWQSLVSLISANSHTLTNVHCCFHFHLEF